ncbi:sensor histidine kinase [Niabella hibiscisoli]|uniref:sensor histidine kinase n=1 Tax=Niabella hibiscisoli TaxID=1825928 RepID=UPI001F10EC32|nr:ATP-binding protein [Niabella hibiscisoli]MCH5719528.1 ATP-binding protein [Niabella hibiscisoli]
MCNNLLSNAFKYTRPGDTVVLGFEQQNDQMLLTVSDTGLGIASADHERVFERFYQVNYSDSNWGSGVGLAFAKSLAELHRGTIALESEPDKGTVFTVRLPVTHGEHGSEEMNNSHYYSLLVDNYAAPVTDTDDTDEYEARQ